MTSTNYPTDLTDVQWENLLPYLPEPSPLGRPLKWEMRSIINAIFYIVKSGCQWRMLPHQMPPWQTVYSHFRKWKIDGTWFMIHQALHNQTRCDVGKTPSPTVAIIDSQSVKTTELANSRGFDAHKKVKGRKRHIVTDTIGIVLGVKVTDANVSDNQVAIELLTEIFRTCFKKQRMIPQCCGFVNPQRAVSQGRGWVSQPVGLGNQAPTIDLTRFPKYSENVPLNSGLRKKPSFEEKTRFQGK